MSPPRATTEAAMADKQDRILDAALRLFAERGFHGTAMPALAREAGVGAGTIYRYFDSKESLVNALYRREKERVTGFVMDTLPVDRSPREQFSHLVLRVIAFARDNRESFTFLEHHHHADYLDERSRAIEERVLALVLAFLAQTTAARITKPVLPQVLIAVVWGGLVRLMKEAWDGHVELTDEVVEQAEAVLWEAVRL